MKLYKSRFKSQYYVTHSSFSIALDDFLIEHLYGKNVYCVIDGYDSDIRSALLSNFDAYGIKSLICKGALKFTTTPTLTVNTAKRERKLKTKSIGFHNNRFDKPLGKKMDDVFVIAFINEHYREFTNLLRASNVSYLIGTPKRHEDETSELFSHIHGSIVKCAQMKFMCVAHDKDGNIYEPIRQAPSFFKVNWYSNVK